MFMFNRYQTSQFSHEPTRRTLLAFNILCWFLVAIFMALSILAYSVNYPSWYLLVIFAAILCPLTPGHPLLKVFLGGIVLALL